MAEDSIVLKGILKKLRNFTLLFDELFVLLRNFPFSAREAMHDYHLQTWYIRVATRVAE